MRAHFKAWLEAFEGTTSKRSYFAAYNIVFLILFFAMSFSFLFAGKGFIWNVDGLEQQYVFFAYEGEWLRELLYNIFVARTGVVPVWSLEIGYGADVIMTLLPSLGDPLNLLSVLVPMEYADLALNASVPLHLYLAGLAFSGFCFYRAKDRFSVLVSSMVYVFSGYTLLAFSQIFMLYPLLLGPLVVWGIEKVLARESPLLLYRGNGPLLLEISYYSLCRLPSACSVLPCPLRFLARKEACGRVFEMAHENLRIDSRCSDDWCRPICTRCFDDPGGGSPWARSSGGPAIPHWLLCQAGARVRESVRCRCRLLVRIRRSCAFGGVSFVRKGRGKDPWEFCR